MSGTIEISGWFNIAEFLQLWILKKLLTGFGKTFITLIEILLQDQRSCIINGEQLPNILT